MTASLQTILNPELQRQHEAAKARRARFFPAVVARQAVPAPVVPAPVMPIRKAVLAPVSVFEKRVSIARVVQETAVILDISSDLILSRRRSADLVTARHIAMYLAAIHCGKTLTQLGMYMGRDHTTILHAKRSIERRKKVEPAVANLLACVRAKLGIVSA